MVAFLLFLFPSLAAMRRLGELVQQRPGPQAEAGLPVPAWGDAPAVAAMAVGAGYAAVMVFALRLVFTAPEPLPIALWAICPILLYWISRMALLANRGRLDDDPLVFAARDPASLACAVGIAGLALASAL